MESPSADIVAMYQEAEAYHEHGDVYNAVKLCKRIIKRVPTWYPPHALLGDIYKYRQEWKAALHYNKKSVALDASDRNAWWNIGIAATALKKTRLARSIWAKFGLSEAEKLPNLKSVRIAFGKQFDIIWVRPLDPARGVISSIPSPATGRCWRDTILLDGVVAGYNVVNGKKYPVFEALGLYKRSRYHTFSCKVYLENADDLKNLERLCLESGLGFENWSNAAWMFSNQHQKNALPEYYGTDSQKMPDSMREAHVAIAARKQQEVEEVLRAWQLISLGYFSDLTCHL